MNTNKNPKLKQLLLENQAKYCIDSLKVSILTRGQSVQVKKFKYKPHDSPFHSQKNTQKLIKRQHIRTQPNQQTSQQLLFLSQKSKTPIISKLPSICKKQTALQKFCNKFPSKRKKHRSKYLIVTPIIEPTYSVPMRSLNKQYKFFNSANPHKSSVHNQL